MPSGHGMPTLTERQEDIDIMENSIQTAGNKVKKYITAAQEDRTQLSLVFIDRHGEIDRVSEDKLNEDAWILHRRNRDHLS